MKKNKNFLLCVLEKGFKIDHWSCRLIVKKAIYFKQIQ